MGGKNSKESIRAESDQHLNELETRLETLEREEKIMEEKLKFMESQKDNGDATKAELMEQMRESLNSKDRKINKLLNEIEILKNSVLDAEKQYEELQLKVVEGRLDDEAYQSMVCMSVIDNHVQGWLDDPNINITLVPDIMEKYIYKKIIGSFLSSLEKMFQSLSFVLLGHSISVIMRPVRKE